MGVVSKFEKSWFRGGGGTTAPGHGPCSSGKDWRAGMQK